MTSESGLQPRLSFEIGATKVAIPIVVS